MRTGSASFSTGCPGIFRKTRTASRSSTAPRSTSTHDPRQGEHRDWGTLIFNYGRNEVRNFLLANALFWLHEYHVDGLRVDAVASMLYLDYSRKQGEWVPNRFGGRENLEAIEFLRELNTLTHAEQPGSITVAEESTAWPSVSRPTYVGGLGFTYKWNMGWMNDILEYVTKDPVYRRWDHRHLTFSLLYAFTENFILPFSHDEVVHGKGSMFGKIPGDDWQKAATLRALYGFMYAHPGKKLMFMGCEFGQGREWNYDQSLDWHLLERPLHQGLRHFVQDLNRTYATERALFEVDFDRTGFQWIDCNDSENSVVSFIRRAKDGTDFLVAILNFTPVPRDGYRIGVPVAGPYLELVNSDGEVYGGGNRRQRRRDLHRAARGARPRAVPATAPPTARLSAAQAGRGRSALESFHAFCDRKTREADVAPARAARDDRGSFCGVCDSGELATAGLAGTYDGPFHLPALVGTLVPCVSLVFVQSRDRNTVTDNPEDLGGGPLDKHLLYEGLSRVGVGCGARRRQDRRRRERRSFPSGIPSSSRFDRSSVSRGTQRRSSSPAQGVSTSRPKQGLQCAGGIRLCCGRSGRMPRARTSDFATDVVQLVPMTADDLRRPLRMPGQRTWHPTDISGRRSKRLHPRCSTRDWCRICV